MTKNPAHSVLERLRNVARHHGREYQATLLLYAQERWLARLAASPERDHFVLKGGLYLYSRYREAARPTQDMDFAGRATSNEVEAITARVRAVSRIDLADAVTFDLEGMTGLAITEEAAYPGVRVKFTARIGQARLPMTLDVGFGDEITPAPAWQRYPVLLPQEGFELLTITPETVVAEKFQAMVLLGARNTRLKDFYDLFRMANSEPFAADQLGEAIERTLARRGTPPDMARAFLERDFTQDVQAQQLWQGYLRRSRLAAPSQFAEVMRIITSLLQPILAGQARGRWNPERQAWQE